MMQLVPIPDAQGIAKLQELYLNRFGKRISDEETAEVLGRLMRYLYHLNQLAEETKDM